MNLILTSPLFETGVFVFGLLIGSFLNVVILRLPARLENEWRSQCQQLLDLPTTDDASEPPGIVKEGSRCPKCGQSIRAWENIPVLSWLLLRAKCSGCNQAISVRYPLVELLTALLYLLVALHFGPTWQTAAGLVFTALLVAMTGIDVDHQLLPDNLTLPLLWMGLLLSIPGLFTNPVDSIIGAAAGYGVLWAVFHMFKLVTGKEGMGFGDLKLLAALGAWMGWQALPMIIFLSSMTGAIVGLLLMAIKRHKHGQPLPFGPFIAASGFLSLLWGEQIVRAYQSFSQTLLFG